MSNTEGKAMSASSSTKKQLFTAVAMLVVAAVALGTATYAWFLNNAAAKVDGMNFQASSASTLEIAVADSVDWDAALPSYTTMSSLGWKGIVTSEEIKAKYGMAEADLFKTLMPASSSNAAGFFQVNGLQGWDLTKKLATTFSAITKFNVDADGGANIKASNGDVVLMPLFIRSSSDMDVYLQDITGSAPVTGGSIAGSLRVAVVPYDGVAGNVATGSVKILENPDVHTTGAGLTTEGQGDAGNAILSVGSNGVPTFAAQNAVDFKKYTVKEGIGEKAGFAGDTTGKNPLFTLKANEPVKLAVYVWMEGCDYDCVTSAADQEFSVNLNLIGDKKN